MADRIYAEDAPRETVVIERDHDDVPGRSNNGALIVAIVVIALILLFLLVGNPFAGGGGDVNVQTPAPTSQ